MDATTMTASSSSAPAPTLSSSKDWKYEVFLSFRGEDTRKTITDHLYLLLGDQKVNVFIDENALRRGESITDELKKAIEGSRISVIVFSSGYAESRWCLGELEKIMECRTTLGQTVLPVFYKVKPSDVRNQTGCFAQAFEDHEVKGMGEEKVRRWRDALAAAANLAGMELLSTNGYEGQFVREIVSEITSKLYNTFLKVATYEVGVDSRVKDITDHLQVGGLDDVRIVGIWGMVGAGRTMVAKAIFNRFHHLFDGKSFLQSVRENDMVKLQNQLLEDVLTPPIKRVSSIAEGTKAIKGGLGKRRLLVIIDDVDCVEQLHMLAIKHGSFGPGSRIIITTTNKQLLKTLEVDVTCLAQLMNEEEAGIDSHVEAISHHLQVKGLEDVRIVGILGMVGAGKTTVAKAIFNRFGDRFDGKSFLHSVRENDMVKLQNQLLKDVLTPAIKKVRSIDEGTKEIEEKLGNLRLLVIFDDVDSVEQLHRLAIKHGSFGPGSRIIITTTNEQLLKTLGVDETCLAQLMNEKEALELFSWHAFRKNTPDEEYLNLSREVVDYCRGLPLALQVLGSYLCKTEVFKWRCALDMYKRVPHEDIQKKLKVSYDGLNGDNAKDIFLDISCFFIGMEKDYVMAVLDGCNLYPQIGIGELLDRCLLTVDKEGNMMMHDLIRDMGREIVCAESRKTPEERSRLWHPEDIKEILKQKSGTKKIQGIALDLLEADNVSFSSKAFKKMVKLRLLELKGVKFTGHRNHLSGELRWLCWHMFPLNVIPKHFNQPNLIAMDLSHSNIQVWQDPVMPLGKLKFLNLGYCQCLKRSPDFSKLPNLEKVILQNCTSLSKIHHSIGELKNLVYLCLANCNLTDETIKDLKGLPSLEIFDLRGNYFFGIPILSGLLKLRTLQLDNCTNLQAIPDLPTNLEILEANDCTALKRMPDFSKMLRMTELHLNHSRKLTEVPGLDKSLNCMTKIHMEECFNLTADFKEAIGRGWSASGKIGGLFLPPTDFPSCFREVEPKDETVVPHLSENNEDTTHEAGPADDSSYETCSHKRLRSGCNAEEETDAGEDCVKRTKLSGDQGTTAFKLHVVETDPIIAEGDRMKSGFTV